MCMCVCVHLVWWFDFYMNIYCVQCFSSHSAQDGGWSSVGPFLCIHCFNGGRVVIFVLTVDRYILHSEVSHGEVDEDLRSFT